MNKNDAYKRLTLYVFALLTTFFYSSAQEKTPEKVAERFFMPALQLGYIDHNLENISSGLMLQTSLEYRTKKSILLRLNYDDFSGRINLTTPLNQKYNARIPLSELICGFGYRQNIKRHNYFVIVQSGVRFYENPIIENENGNINIEQKGSTINTVRYTLGYEYEIFESVFFNS